MALVFPQRHGGIRIEFLRVFLSFGKKRLLCRCPGRYQGGLRVKIVDLKPKYADPLSHRLF